MLFLPTPRTPKPNQNDTCFLLRPLSTGTSFECGLVEEGKIWQQCWGLKENDYRHPGKAAKFLSFSICQSICGMYLWIRNHAYTLYLVVFLTSTVLYFFCVARISFKGFEAITIANDGLRCALVWLPLEWMVRPIRQKLDWTFTSTMVVFELE